MRRQARAAVGRVVWVAVVVAALLVGVVVFRAAALLGGRGRPLAGGAPQAAGEPAAPAAALGLPADMELDLGGGMTMKLALIPAGEFLMGSPAGEAGRGDHEGPQHRVRITKAFYMGATQVTQEQYQAVMGKNPSWFKGAKNPVEQVSWNDAQEFCRRLSAKTGKTVRLPTEAEWEYACRAGTTTKWSCGDQEGALGEYAWHGANAGERTHDVGGKKPNAFGLYDMHGNVFEWCQDWCDASYYANSPLDDPSGAARGYARALRGGSWNVTPEICRSAYRFGYGPGLRFAHLGFRAVVSVAGGLD